MTALLWIGAALVVAGLGALGWCIREALRLKRADLTPDQAKTRMRLLVAVNAAAVGGAFLGLALMLAGGLLAP
ncbi:MAG: hypothetical protein AAGC57_04740 [Pseudomonadota bacterium]